MNIVLVLGPYLLHRLYPRLIRGGPNDTVIQVLSFVVFLEQLGQDGKLGIMIIRGILLHELVQNFALKPGILLVLQRGLRCYQRQGEFFIRGSLFVRALSQVGDRDVCPLGVHLPYHTHHLGLGVRIPFLQL